MDENICAICKKCFTTKSALKVHMKTKCKSSEKCEKVKNFICVCGKTLSSNQMLKYHIDSCVDYQISKKEEEHNKEYNLLREQIKENSILTYNSLNQTLFLYQTEINKISLALKNDFMEKIEKNQLSLDQLKTELDHIKNVQNDFEEIKKVKNNALQKVKDEIRKEVIIELKDEIRKELKDEIRKEILKELLENS